MNFILDLPFIDTNSPDWPRKYSQSMQRYHEYLLSVESSLPPKAREYVFADWHYDQLDHRSPHDARVKGVQILETAPDQISINATFLSAYQDFHLQLCYANVKAYNLELPRNRMFDGGHNDLLIDQITMDDVGGIVHDVVFRSGGKWKVVCADIECLHIEVK